MSSVLVSIREGSTGSAVRMWQAFLRGRGAVDVLADGNFGPRTTAATSLAAAESVTTTHRNAESSPDRMYRHSSCSRPPAAAAAAAVARESIPLIPDCSQLGRLQSLSSLAAAAPARGAERRLISPGGDKAQRPRDEAQRRRNEVRRRRSGVGAS